MHHHPSRVRHIVPLVGAAIIGVILGFAPVAAHHGWGGYLDAEFELQGTLAAPVSVAGPHATMKIRSGEQVWDAVLAPPARTISAGLTEGVIPVGAPVVAHGHRHSDAKRFEMKTERVTWNGRVFDVYPDRK